MKRKIGHILTLLVMAASLLTLSVSCSRYGKQTGQSTEFATFIKAHTGGIISNKGTIRVELASSIPTAEPGADLKEGILTFSPAIKGTSRWITPSIIEFIPENGALKPGESYTGRLRLDKIHKVSNRRFRKFTFNFLVAIKEAKLTLGDLSISAASANTATVDGTISLTEELPLEKVQSMFTYSYPAAGSESNVTPGTDALHFRFEILGLERSDSDRPLKISLKAGDTGFRTDSKLDMTVPATGNFKIMRADLIEADDPFIRITFTEPLSEPADISGLFVLEGVGNSYVQTEGSNVKVYFDSPSDAPLRLIVSDAVSSMDGQRLKGEYSKEFTFKEEKPAVEIPVTGNILPNSKELILPFRAVNLKCVDIRVIQIYEENVLMFLQDNNLDGQNSIRRAGRLVCKRCLRLDSDPSKNLHKWQDFSVNLSSLFKQEPGAIYRVRFSFKQDYSIYGKNDAFRSGTPSDELVDIASEDVTEEDDQEWDTPYPDYWENFYDWSKYNWKDRDNPLKPTYYMDVDRFPAINLLTSNLGVIAKYAGGDRLWVSVSDIITANPVFNSELYVYSYQLKEIGYAKTGTDGMAEIALSGKPFAVVAKRGGATSYLKVTEGNENSLSRFDVGGKKLEKGLKAFIYGERGVWRPGDVLHVTMILEDKEKKIPDNHPVSMELYTPEGQFYTKLINSSGKDGFYLFDIATKADDPTGTWHAYFKVGGATFSKALKIESIKPNRLKINTDFGQEVLSGGGKARIDINSSWLTGPPASELRAKVRMTLRRGATTFKGFENYDFTSPLSEYVTSEHDLIDARLGMNGHLAADVNMPAAENAPGMLTADIFSSVQEPGGDISFSTMTMAYSPFSSYIGIKVDESKDGTWLETDKDHSFKVATVDKNGKRVSGTNISYAIYKLKWSWWWESRNESLDSYVNGSSAEALTSGTMVSGSSDSVIPFRIDYPEWGRYLVIVKNNDSGHICGKVIYVDWPASRGRSNKTDPDALTMLSFSTDKDTYDVGETATVYIPSASKGQALVSIENSRTVISREWVKATGEEDVRYTFKVTPEMAPNFFVHVSLVQPHERTDNDLPIRLYGVRPVSVNDKDSHLEPEISMPDVLRPEEEFSIKIREKSGRPMTYTLAIVDEGLLDITSFKTPDPWKSMYEREALGVSTWDLYDDVIGAFSGRFSPMFSIGGDENLLMGAKKDNRFNAVVKFIGPCTLTGGSASHKITLPMYVGSVRVMVVAARDAAYGNCEKTVPVKSPLMVLPTLPRVVADGEKVTMPVNVFALEDGISSADVAISVKGPLKTTGEDKTSVSFSGQGDKLARFNLEAVGTGTATVTATATGHGHKASQTITIEVKKPNLATVSVNRMLIGKGETKHFGFSPFMDGPDDWASLELSSCPTLDINSIYASMVAYQFRCSEQLAAVGMTLLNIKDKVSDQKKADIEKHMPDIIQTLCQRQRPDGGFAMWPEDSSSQPWISSMAGQFMTMASKNGYTVSKGVLASWSRYQKKLVQEYRAKDNAFLWDLEQAYRLYTLALEAEPENGAMNRLKESTDLSEQAAWMLACAYSVSGKKAVATDIISKLKSDFPAYQSKDQTFGSPLRDKAIALEALVLADDLTASTGLASEIAKGLNEDAATTQETAFATNAMTRFMDKIGSGSNNAINASLAIGDEHRNIQSAKPFSSTTIGGAAGGFDVTNNSESGLFATLTVSRIQDAAGKVEAKASGVSLSVSYLTSAGAVLNPSDIAQGTDFQAVVTVRNISAARDLENMALTEMVPSGWEILNDRISAADKDMELKDIRDDRVIWHFDLPKGTAKTFRIKLQAAYEGEYVLPAIKCEAMYDPHVCANTASGTAKVTR